RRRASGGRRSPGRAASPDPRTHPYPFAPLRRCVVDMRAGTFAVLLAIVVFCCAGTARAADPQTVVISFGSYPHPRPAVSVDGESHATPYNLEAVVGSTHSIEAPNQDFAGSSYWFEHWDDGGGQTHTIVTPDHNTSWFATYAAGAVSAPHPHIDSPAAGLQWARRQTIPFPCRPAGAPDRPAPPAALP